MATKKEENKNIDKKKMFESVLKELNTRYKDTPISILTKFPKVEVETISSGSLSLDSIIGGGIPKGRIIEIYGPEASGKTSIALIAAANVQKAGGNVVFLDVEQALDCKYAKKLGVNLNSLGFCQPSIAEDILIMIKELCESGSADMIIVDSVAAMVPKTESEQDFDKSTIGLLARLLSKALKQLSVSANKNKCTIIFLNQIRDNVGVLYGPSTSTTGGRALKFYASQRIEVKRKGKVEDENGDIIGNEVILKCVKNKIAPPYGEAKTVLTFNKGINQAAELLVLGEDLGVIQKEGRTYYCQNVDNKDISGGKAEQIENNRIKIGVNSKPVLEEIENNKKLFDLLSEQTIKVLNEKNGLVDYKDKEIDYEEEITEEI